MLSDDTLTQLEALASDCPTTVYRLLKGGFTDDDDALATYTLEAQCNTLGKKWGAYLEAVANNGHALIAEVRRLRGDNEATRKRIRRWMAQAELSPERSIIITVSHNETIETLREIGDGDEVAFLH